MEISGLADVSRTVAALQDMVSRVEAATPEAVAESAELLGNVYRAVGDKRTGRMVGSYTYRMTGPYSAEAGPTVVYGRRNEIGFRGPDSIGRRFHQRGHHGLEHAVDVARPAINAKHVEVWMEAIG